MTSKLFHSIVVVGISLGSAAGCVASPDGTESSDRASVAQETVQPTDQTPIDAFCDVAWPTTKGAAHSGQVPECIDPEGACAGTPPSACLPQSSDSGCAGEATYAVCAAGSWDCKPGRTAVPPDELVDDQSPTCTPPHL